MALSSSRLTYSTPEPLDQKQLSEAQAFHTIAMQSPGGIIRTCSLNPSGCIDWGKQLQAAFPAMEAMTTTVCRLFDLALIDTPIEDKPLHTSTWEYLIVTGCLVAESATIVDALSERYDFSHVKHLYAIVPPHLQAHNGCQLLPKALECEFNSQKPSYKIHILSAGINITQSSQIGMPKLCPTLTSSYLIPKNCYGLFYHRNPLDQGRSYLDNYFKRVANAGKDCKESTVSVLGIATDEDERDGIRNIAAHYRVDMIYLTKLPQADFLKAIQDIGKKGGIITTDGVGTLLQAVDLGAKVFAYNSDYTVHNDAFYRQLVSSLPKKQQAIGEVLFGESKDYDQLNEADKEVSDIFDTVRDTLKKSVTKFESDHTCRFFKNKSQSSTEVSPSDKPSNKPDTEQSNKKSNSR